VKITELSIFLVMTDALEQGFNQTMDTPLVNQVTAMLVASYASLIGNYTASTGTSSLPASASSASMVGPGMSMSLIT